MATSAAVTLPDDPKIRGDIALPDPIAGREPLVRGTYDFHAITEMVLKVNETEIKKTPMPFVFGLALAGSVLAMFIGYIGYLFWEGPGIWGNNNPVGWAWDIVNFVFWVGIGHAGTLISAILFLFRQKWRTSINRSAEAMTIFAVVCRRLFPGAPRRPHLARLLPLPASPTRWGCGRTSAARCCGTCSRSPPTSRCRCCSGSRA